MLTLGVSIDFFLVILRKLGEKTLLPIGSQVSSQWREINIAGAKDGDTAGTYPPPLVRRPESELQVLGILRFYTSKGGEVQ